jgi:hypothetical protein
MEIIILGIIIGDIEVLILIKAVGGEEIIGLISCIGKTLGDYAECTEIVHNERHKEEEEELLFRRETFKLSKGFIQYWF